MNKSRGLGLRYDGVLTVDREDDGWLVLLDDGNGYGGYPAKERQWAGDDFMATEWFFLASIAPWNGGVVACTPGGVVRALAARSRTLWSTPKCQQDAALKFEAMEVN